MGLVNDISGGTACDWGGPTHDWCGHAVTRRATLLSLSALLLGCAHERLPRSLPRQDRVDIHYHPIAPDWIAHPRVQAAIAPQVMPIARRWTPQVALEEMDRNGIELAVSSVANPGVWFGDVSDARRLARHCNDFSAALKHDYPGRFAFFAALPLPDIAGSVDEIGRSFDRLGADGVGLFTSYGDTWLADERFAPIFEELNRRGAVVYVHPAAPDCCKKLVPGLPAALIEYPVDTTRAMLHWLRSGSRQRYPALKLIFSHAGGYTMGGLGRLQLLAQTHPEFGLPKDIAAEVAKFWFEISSSADPVTLQALRAYVPVSQILLGTDSPFIGSMTPNLAQLANAGLSATELAAIERGNALRLLGLNRQ
jgi:6-methylsalicylate decarboxylase